MVSHLRAGQPIARRERRCDNEVTDVFPIINVSPIRDLNPFATDIAVLASPELDDTSDLPREWPLFLLPPRSTRHATPMRKPNPVLGSIRAGDADAPARQHRSAAGRHRKHVTAGREAAFRGPLVATAVAAGAVAAAINIAGNTSGAQAAAASASASARNSQPPQTQEASGVQIVAVSNTADSTIHREEFSRGVAFADERAAREARLRRPPFVFPTRGILTSEFGNRWGTLHGGLDIANAIGTPIYAASDGVVIAAGPTPGFGMWVKIRDANGTVTLYGHIDTATVQVGDRVFAGDQIATMGKPWQLDGSASAL